MTPEEKVKILVVDDLQENLLVYHSILDEPGQEVVAARSGPEALRQVLHNEFAVILLDVNMPGMDGFETAVLIRGRKRSAHTPIIFVTAHADELHTLRGYTYGAVDYILTPVVPEILRTKVRVFVELTRLTQQARAQAALDIARAENERARLAAVLETATDLVGSADANGRLVSLNRAGMTMLGYTTAEGPRAMPNGQPPWVDQIAWKAALATAGRDGVWFGEAALQSRDGAVVPVSQVVLAHRAESGHVDSYSVIARDVAERKRAEEAVNESERRYRQLVQSLPAAVYTCDASGRVTLYNSAAAELWGREPVLGEDSWCGSWKIYHPDGSPMAIDDCPMARTLRTGQSVRGEEIIIERPDGTRRHVAPHPEPIVDASGALVGAVNMLMDVTDRKVAEQTRALLAAIVDSTDDAVISKSLDGVLTWCNQGAERLYGYTASELVGKSVRVLVPRERREEEDQILRRLHAGEHIEHFETVRMRKDGAHIDVSLAVSPVRDSQGRIIGASSIARDITERKKGERALRESASRLRAMFGQAAVGMALVNQKTQFLEVNQRLCQIIGRTEEELCGITCESITHMEDWTRNEPLMRELTGGARSEFAIEKRYKHGNGSWVWVNVTVSPLSNIDINEPRYVVVVEDINARKLAEHEVHRHREHLEHLVRERTSELEASLERLRLTDRLASIGTLAAGLGHDMGNLLLPVRMRLEALQRMDLPESAKEDVQAISDSCEYLKRLNRGLRLFALNPTDLGASGERSDLGPWWTDVAPFLRNTLPRGIELHADFPPDLPSMAIAPHVLTQAIYNLVQNAGDALAGRPGGRVDLAASRTSDGRSVVFHVADNGPGMDEEVVRRCMEPFFTTKTRGISTGLGLALVRGAVNTAGGSIDIRSKQGVGTTFILTFPAAEINESRDGSPEAERACVSVRDPRMRAYVGSLLQSLRVEVVHQPWSRETIVPLLVLDDPGDRFTELEEFIAADPARRAIVFGGSPPSPAPQRVTYLDSKPAAVQLCAALDVAVRGQRRAPQEVRL